jgi:hypothetical protein
MSIDAWLDGDDAEVDIVALLDDGAVRRDLVELALIENLLPRVTMAARPRSPRRRIAFVAAGVAVVAILLVLWLRRDDVARPRPQVVGEPGVQMTIRDDSVHVMNGGASIVAPDDRGTVVETPVGPVSLAARTRVTIRVSAEPAAMFVGVDAGAATIGQQTLRDGEGLELGDVAARRHLGPRIGATILRVDGNHLEVRTATDAMKELILSRNVEIDTPMTIGAEVTLILAPNQSEVFVVEPPTRL